MASASQIINDFAKRTGTGSFKNLNRNVVAKELRDRVTDPSKIDQGYSSLCGAAAFLYCTAKNTPEKYAQYIVDLFEKGEASIGNLQVKPAKDCKNYKVPAGKIAETDWIGLASLRDSENIWFDYDSVDDEFSGITAPGAVASWFTKSGFSKVKKDTSLIIDESLYTLLQAHQQRKSGAWVCLLIGANILWAKATGKKAKKKKAKGAASADHWVVLNDDITIDGQPVTSLLAKGKQVNDDDALHKKRLQFAIYTWGEDKRQLDKGRGTVTIEEFLDYFYGYVAAK